MKISHPTLVGLRYSLTTFYIIFNSRYYHPWNERRQPVLLVEVGPLAPLTLATETTYACVEYATVGTHKDAIIQ